MSQSQFIRKAKPECLRYFLQAMIVGRGEEVRTATIEKLIHCLTNEANYEKHDAKETVTSAISDGLLMLKGNISPNNLSKNRHVTLPKESEIAHSTHDCYCFECHLPGMLEQCMQCTRSFHRLCYRKDAERPNYSVPSGKLQKNRLPAFSSDTEVSDTDPEVDADCNASTTQDSSVTPGEENDLRASSTLLQSDHTSSVGWTPTQQDELVLDSNSSPLIVQQHQQQHQQTSDENLEEVVHTSISRNDFESKKEISEISESEDKCCKADVLYLGEVRPPMRKRPATTASSISYKSEVSPMQDEDIDYELCTCCRLLKSATLRHPPNMQPDELCYLLHFTFDRNRTWMGTDVLTYMKYMKLSVQEQKIVTQLLYKVPSSKMTLEEISKKLQTQFYTNLTAFLVDLLDFQHSIGVFFGYQSTEMESTKWLVRDICHDLAEIRRCPDCFRHSHEKDSRVWFAKPCLQRHELVYAKHSGFCYWPAKVIRVLPSSKYDVRFFGSNHSRALIDVRYIRPIDTDTKSLKLNNTYGLRKAMEELRQHQALSGYPPDKFSFHADKQETEAIICNVIGYNVNGERKRGRSKRTQHDGQHLDEHNNNINNTSRGIDEGAEIATIGSGATNTTRSLLDVDNNELYGKRKRTRLANDEQPKRVTRSLQSAITPGDMKEVLNELKKTTKFAETTKSRNDKLQAQIKKLKEAVKKHECEQRKIKRMQWCYWCLEEAIYLCCFRASYCSKECQERHWKDGHSKVCKNARK